MVTGGDIVFLLQEKDKILIGLRVQHPLIRCYKIKHISPSLSIAKGTLGVMMSQKQIWLYCGEQSASRASTRTIRSNRRPSGTEASQRRSTNTGENSLTSFTRTCTVALREEWETKHKQRKMDQSNNGKQKWLDGLCSAQLEEPQIETVIIVKIMKYLQCKSGGGGGR